ncbi:CubicO group peptidase, beta-lactamase class C family [Marivirga sericea]|uniref:CubicO group peptidase, beta-lactamase class C family n=1 Tax=Marivirga sericea TaxID=1028 RepID=A0A1X7K4F9_9BACT|nr:serine hydrolase domain-containing protein [Marivirga sericea]SMG35832.1 CubicO group peptidase, beta-lactamase class C family [Marivirga sericea]
MRTYKYIVLITICLFALTCRSQNEKPITEQETELKISAKSIAEILSFFPADEPGGTFLATQNGKHIASAAFGKSNLELDIDMQLNNLFNIASLTKPFTAVAIFTLIEKGKISLNDTVSKFVPNFPKEGGEITIGHLLSHSSGMEYKNDEQQRNNFKRAIKNKNNPDFILEYFTKEKFDAKPGNKFDYNNVAYQLLGYIIELVSGKTYEAYLKEVFFTPLRMNNTFLESTSKVIKDRAIGYDSFDGQDYQVRKIDSDDSYFYSAGGLMSTVEDLSRWYEALMSYEIISQKNLEKLIRPIQYNNGTYAANGYGVFTGNLNGHDFVLHDGLGWGYGAIVLYFPKSKLFIAHLRNCGYCKYDVGLSYGAPIKIASILLNSAYFNNDYPNTALLKEYAGSYQSPFSNEVKIIIEQNNKLYLKSKRLGSLLLMPINENTFFIERNNETITFKKQTKNEFEMISNKGLPIVFEKI